MKRWASGFFQNFQSHKREALRSPSALLVVGTLLFDLLMLPVVYLAALWLALRHGVNQHWLLMLGGSIAVHFAICMTVVTRTISWRQAVVGFACYWIVNWWNKSIYLWTFV